MDGPVFIHLFSVAEVSLDAYTLYVCSIIPKSECSRFYLAFMWTTFDIFWCLHGCYKTFKLGYALGLLPFYNRNICSQSVIVS